MTGRPSAPELAAELENLRARLAEAEEALRAIRSGEVDAVLIAGGGGDQVYTLSGADRIYRRLIETMSEGALTLSAGGVILYCNVRSAEMLGRPLDQVLGTALRDFLPPADQRALDALLAHADKEPSRREINLKTSEGGLMPVYLSASCLGSEGAEAVVCLVLTDLTEQKSHERIAAAEQMARLILDQAAEAIVVCDEQGRIMRTSQAAQQFCEGDPLMRPFAEVFSLRTGASDPLHLTSVLQGGTLGSVEVGLERQGQDFHFLVNAGPLLKDRKVLGCVITLTDITQRKRAEAALLQSENEFRAMFELASIGIAQADPHTGRWLRVNQKMCAITGYTAEELLGLRIPDITHPDDRQEDVELFQRVVRGEAADYNLEKRYVRKNGSVVWVNVNMTVISDPNGLPIRTVATIEDVTERKRAEEALRESEARHRGLFEHSPLGIYQTTPDGKVLAANPALLTALGYSSVEELTARNLDVDGYEPRYSRREFKERIERDGEVIGFESAWLKKDGQVLFVRESARAVRDRDGTTLYYEGTIEDVTAQRRGEEERRRLVAAVEQASEMVVITDTEGRIEFANPAFERTTGYTREEVAGHELTLLRSGKHDDGYDATLWQTIAQTEIWQGRFVNRRKDGSLYKEEATISPIRDASGTIVNFVAVKRDVTQELALQDQLRQAQKMESIGLLAGGVAHDFNNVLQGMLNHVEVVRGRHADADRMAATMTELETEIRRGSTLIRQLLLFAKRGTAKPEQFDLNANIRGAAQFLRRLVRANIGYSMDLADEPLPVTADRGQIDQVLMNLVVNAADAMPGGGSLTIRSGRQGQEWVWFATDDTGDGIPAEIRERIFEPFFTTKGKGTGLGLSVVHGIVTQHGGVVTFEDRPGGGTSFRVALPRAGSGEHPIVSTPTVDTSSSPAGHGERVLVVEDEEGARQGLAEILRMLAYDVVAVGSGEEAGLLPHDPGFDVLLTDMMLPGCAGSDLARGLLERWPTLKVILMSGYTEDEAVRRGALAGRLRFLQKPFDMGSLAREIRGALEE